MCKLCNKVGSKVKLRTLCWLHLVFKLWLCLWMTRQPIFKNLLSVESWNEVFNHSDENSSLKAYMDIFLFCFETAITYNRQKLREIRNNRWLSKGLINSSKRMKILNNVKRRFTLMNEALKYIKNIKKMCKRVLKEAKNKRQWQTCHRGIYKN